MADGDRVALLVAHPDDETLWAGGTVLSNPTWATHVATLCRESDADRAPRFYEALRLLGVTGNMADLDDGPEQAPLHDHAVETALLRGLPSRHFDRILTHSPLGEYTRHRRHEEVACAVLRLWVSGTLRAPELWLFAYDDAQGSASPRAMENADIRVDLAPETIRTKKQIIGACYGFAEDSWEALALPEREAFWRVKTHAEALVWLAKGTLTT